MLIEIKNLNLSFHYGQKRIHALRNVSLNLYENEVLGVVGESGCGKSLTNLALMGLLPKEAKLNADQFQMFGQNFLNSSESQWRNIRGKNISMIFQDALSALNPSLNVKTQLIETIRAHHSVTMIEAEKKSLEMLSLVGIPSPEERLKSFPHELSGGLCQRVMIAMSLISRPKVLLADEPTTALDVTIQKQILILLKDLQKELGMSMIFVTHDLGVMAQVADRINVMYAGEVIESASTKTILRQPKHPYTYGLIKSLPEENNQQLKTKLYSIEGVVPSMAQRPQGCQFAPRCFLKDEKCSQQDIELISNSDFHLLRCLKEVTV